MAQQIPILSSPDLPSTRTQGVLGLSAKRGWVLLLLVFTGIFLLEFGYRYFDDLARGHSGTFGIRFLEEFTGVYSIFFLLPLVFRFVRLYLFRKKSWISIAVLHIAGGVAFSLLHTTLMKLSRRLIAPILGFGPYDYGKMVYRYPEEFFNDFLVYSVIVLACYLIEHLRTAQAQQLAAAELKMKLAQAQLENLRLQLQPHFLFNTLNTISAVMYEDLGAADSMLQQLSDLLRLTLHAANSQEIPLNQELKITRLYLQIMEGRYEKRLRVTYRVAEESENSLVPQLILQPLVENSLRHGFRDMNSGIDIVIAAGREDNSLVLKVTDCGTGLVGDKAGGAVTAEGLGLTNISRRLEQLYGDDQRFTIANRSDGGAEVTLRLPFRLASSV